VLQVYVASVGIKHSLSFSECVDGKAASRVVKTSLNWKRAAEYERVIKTYCHPNPLSCESFL
jgi:hypothetical protein